MKVGLREANQRFSKVMKAVRAGHEILLTDRGKPMATIRPVARAEDPQTTIHRLEHAGLLRAATKIGPLPRWKPRPIKGSPLSQTLREERDAE